MWTHFNIFLYYVSHGRENNFSEPSRIVYGKALPAGRSASPFANGGEMRYYNLKNMNSQGRWLVFLRLFQSVGGIVARHIFWTASLIILLATGVDCSSAGAAALVQRFPEGQMNWLNGTLRATGVATPSGKSTAGAADPQKVLSVAKVTAQQNLLRCVKQIRISSLAHLDTWVGSDPLVMAKIQEIIKQAPVVKQSYLSDGTVTITLELALGGAFYQLVMPKEIEQIDPVTPVNKPPASATGKPDESRWTGLVVDASGLSLNPVLIPRIIDAQGVQVYGPKYISRDFAVRWGGCGYMTTLEPTVCTDRVGLHPLTVRGLRVTGFEQADIVISVAAASRIRAAAEHVHFMREGRVVVLVGEIGSQ
ncbi:MAG: hypothetical protein DSY89_08405 [Deltaproteobacteria bacterium]|nr:MAG: hypothetical protein DSY89_08405 [Deltaproteobacteria bacterium]